MNSISLVVDKISEVITISATDVEPPPSTRHKSRHYIAGMGKIGQRVKILLDIEAFLKCEDLD